MPFHPAAILGPFIGRGYYRKAVNASATATAAWLVASVILTSIPPALLHPVRHDRDRFPAPAGTGVAAGREGFRFEGSMPAEIPETGGGGTILVLDPAADERSVAARPEASLKVYTTSAFILKNADRVIVIPFRDYVRQIRWLTFGVMVVQGFLLFLLFAGLACLFAMVFSPTAGAGAATRIAARTALPALIVFDLFGVLTHFETRAAASLIVLAAVWVALLIAGMKDAGLLRTPDTRRP